MNERIHELIRLSTVPANQAENYALAKGLIEPTEKLDVAKFAELIVRECKQVLLDMIDEGQGEFDTLDQALTEINEHFGVEE